LRLDVHDFVHPDSLPLFSEYLETCRRGELFHCEAQNIRKDGTAFDIEVYGARLNYRGEPHAFAIVRDISQRKAAERELQRQETMLAHVSRLSTLGEMVAGIAHEVNQPLYSIVNFAKASGNVLAGSDSPDLEALRNWNEEIAAAAMRAGDIVRRLRDFTRRTPAAQRAEDLSAIVRESLGLVRHELRRAAVDVELQLASDLPLVQVDHVQIQQVLVNLLKNAIEALEGHRASGRRVQIATTLDGQRVRVDVADNGPGVGPLAAGNPFDPFVTTKPEGVGLGLPISRTIVEAHGGKIAARANAEGGATFSFTLPISAYEATP
jgi:two-component system sensor kinase FixL